MGEPPARRYPRLRHSQRHGGGILARRGPNVRSAFGGGRSGARYFTGKSCCIGAAGVIESFFGRKMWTSTSVVGGDDVQDEIALQFTQLG